MRPLLCLVGLAACGAPSAPVANRGRADLPWHARKITATPHNVTMVEYTLHRTGDRATLTIRTRNLKSKGKPPLDWSTAVEDQRTYAGTVTGEDLELEGSFGADVRAERHLRLRCVQGLRDIAPTGALRHMRPDAPVGESACGNVGEWLPRERPTNALTCTDKAASQQPRVIVFGEPGIEDVIYYDDGCQSLGGGLRMLDTNHTLRRWEEP